MLVVDRKGRVRAANPAARALLVPSGTAQAAPFPLRGNAAWEPLMRAVDRAFVEAGWPEAGRDVTFEFAPGLARTVRLRVRFTQRREPRAERGRLRAVHRGRARGAGAHAAGEAGGDGPHLGRHRARDPQPAGGDRAGQRAAGRGRDRRRPAPADAHGERQRGAAEAHRRRRDGGRARRAAAGRR